MMLAGYPKLFMSDRGTELIAQVHDFDGQPLSLVGATALVILAQKPDGTTVTWIASPGSVMFPDTKPVTSGFMHYVILSGDLDQSGKWEFQGRVTLPSGTWHSDRHAVVVHEILPTT
jgi:hypothetical protein